VDAPALSSPSDDARIVASATKEVRMFDRITVPIDLSSLTDRALPVADALARRAELPIELVTVTAPDSDLTSVRSDLAERANRLVAPPELRVIEHDDPAVALAELMPGGQRLLCMATHARRPYSDFALGPTARQVAQRSPTPLVLVGPGVKPDRDEVLLDHVLLALDGTEPVGQVVAAAAPFARLLGAPIVVVSVEQASNGWGCLSVTGHRLTDWVEHVIDRLAAAGVRATGTAMPLGRPAGRILGAALPSAWIMLGQRRRSALERLAEQSLSSQLLERSRGPVIALPKFTPIGAAGHTARA
jgi:nucleotide-binding universal stress UspA family protein